MHTVQTAVATTEVTIQEGIEAFDRMAVECERLRHRLNVLSERLDELDAKASLPLPRRERITNFFRRINK